MLTVIVSMLLFALVGAISPGPVNVIATGAGARFGIRGALPHVLGATISYTLIVLLAGLMLNEMAHWLPQISLLMQVAGGAFLLWIAWKIATAPAQSLEGETHASPPGFMGGVLCQTLNPKAWLVSMSGISLFVSHQESSGLLLIVFCVVSFAMCFLGVGCWVVLGQIIRRLLSSTRRQVMFNRVMALLLVVSMLSIISV